MTSANSTSPRPRLKLAKPEKPSPDFPLYPHDCGKWAKTIDGRKYYFGSWDDPDGALAEYRRFLASTQQTTGSAVTLDEILNEFLNAKRRDVEKGDLSKRHWLDHKTTGDLLVQHFGRNRDVLTITPTEWAGYSDVLNNRFGVHRFNNEITRVKQILKWAGPNGRQLCGAANFGPDFRRLRIKTVRQYEQAQPDKTFEPDELTRILDNADPMLRAATLLGINCGYNNADIAWLPRNIKYGEGWLDFPRHKTAVARRSPLWSETIEAMDCYISERPAPRDAEAAKHFFLTGTGMDYVDDSHNNRLAGKMRRLILRMQLKRPGLTFYSLRHTFATVGSRAKDNDALKYLMGHADSSMLATYVRDRDDPRLLAVTNAVHHWLYGEQSEEQAFRVVG